MAEQHASAPAVRDPAQARRWIAHASAAAAAWPLLALSCWLLTLLAERLPESALQGDWAAPVALALGAAASWRLFRTTVPGLLGWLLGAALLALARRAIPDLAGLPSLL